MTRPAGSSPLARGLPNGSECRQRFGRIIPARAGFTPCQRFYDLAARDHPRSRGVYLIWAYTDFPEEGSSPLARGLPMTGPSCPFRWRIIPARAGFTRQSVGSSMPRPDHPRSRGVYPLYIHRYSGVHGSSPLARGLRRSGAPGVYSTGIIPARAGFTLRMVLILGLLSDHPRSRGVYIPGPVRVRTHFGSSPLARGLPLDLPRYQRLRRIIPARAGFTCY